MRRLGILICLSLALASCAGQSASENQAPGQASAKAAGILSRDGCTVDLKKVCQAFIDQPSFIYRNSQYDWASFSQNNPSHAELQLPLNLPNGEYLGMLNCHVVTQNRKATAGVLMQGPPVSDQAISYLKKRGWCEENKADYSKLWAAITAKMGPH